MSNTIGTSCTSNAVTGAVTTTWWRAPPAGTLAPAVAPTSASFGPPVSTTRSVSMGPSEVSTPTTRPPAVRSPVNPQRSRTSTRCAVSAAV